MDDTFRHVARAFAQQLLEMIGDAPVDTGETVDVAGAAALLHTSVRAIYVRRQRGQMPTPVTKRPLVWRKADVLRMGR